MTLRLSLALFVGTILSAQPALEKEVSAAVAGFGGRVSVAAKHLGNGQTFDLDGDRRVGTASVIKVAVMVEAFTQVKEGKLRLDEPVYMMLADKVPGSGILQDLSTGLRPTLEDAISLMIDLSDNTATNLVLDKVGIDNVNKRMVALGLPGTKIFKKVFKPADRPLTEEDKEFGLGSTTAKEMVRLLEMIDRKQVADVAGCERMIAILKKQRDQERIPRYIVGEPKVSFALKSGSLDQHRSDVGLIYTPTGTVAIAVFADQSPDRRWTVDNAATLTIARVARAVYSAWIKPLPPVPGTQASAAAIKYDVILRNGKIVDGSGNPWFYADVAVKDGKIARIGALAGAKAKREIDVTGRVVAPGFIDVHTHVEGGLDEVPTADNFIHDGVTTVITGNCGGSRPDLSEYFSGLTSKGISFNLGSLIGHNAVRRQVMGLANRPSTPEELEKMRELVARSMESGAVGFSTGLIYVPGTYSTREEVVELGKVAGRYGGVYASHMRDEGPAIKEAIEEALAVGREGRMPVQISHFKIDTKSIWGSSAKTLGQVEQARRDGLEVTVDQYPYRASSTGLRANLLPSWVQSDGWDKMKERLTDPATRKKIVKEMSTLLKKKGRKNLDYAVVARCRFDQSLEGKNISQINRLKGRKAKLEQELETVMDLELQGDGQGIQMVYFSMSDDDVERIMRAPFTAVASDAGVIRFGTGMPHPRGYGTNSRSLAVYVREKKVLSLEDAIRRMTSLPAQTFRLRNRGWLREGYAADVVVFDPDKVKDMATFEKPHQYAEGFVAVLVNGEPVVLEGKHTGARPGKVLLGPGTKSNQTGTAAGGGN